MRSILTLILALALLAIVLLDGAGMFMAYEASRSGAQAAAHRAAVEYVSTGGNLPAAQQAAVSFARSKDLEAEGVSLRGTGQEQWFEVTVRAHANTYVLKFIPGVNQLLAQEATGSAQF